MTVTRLGEIADVIAGQSPPGETYNTTGVGLPFFQGKTDFGSRHPVARVWCSAPERIAEPGDVLISVRAPVGPSNVADVPSCIGRGLAAIRARPRLDPAFLAWFMKHQEPSLAALGQGSTFHAITRREIEDIEVSVLPLDEQRRIAKELRDQFDSLQILQASSHARASSSSVLRKILMSEPFHLDLKYPAQCRTIGSISRIQTGYAFRSEWFRDRTESGGQQKHTNVR